MVDLANRAARRTDETIDRWRRRTTQRRRTVYLAVFLIAWFGSGAWVMHTWLTAEPEPQVETGARTTEAEAADSRRGQPTGFEPESGADPVRERLARWAESRREGWQTLAVQPDGSRGDRWRILGRTDNTPQNRVAVLTVDIASDGTVELIDEQLP